MEKKIHIGIVGAGRWAKASHLPALNTLKDIEITAISSFNYNSALEVGNQYNIKHIFHSWEELINIPLLDAVIILSPPKTHYPIVMAALDNKKHVLCEGPLAMNLKQAEEMLVKADNKGLVHGYIRPKLYVDGGPLIKKLLREKIIGNVQNILITWHPKIWLDKKNPLSWRHLISESPPLVSLVPIIILIELFGAIDSVCGNYEILTKKRYSEVDKKDTKATAPDYFQGILHLKNGVPVTVQTGSGHTEHTQSGFQIFGDKGTLVWDWSLPNKIYFGKTGREMLDSTSYSFDFSSEWNFDKNFIEAIKNKSTPEYNFKQGVYEMKVLDALAISNGEKKWITL